MTRSDLQKLLDLPVDEKMQLAELLWQSVEPDEEARFLAVPEWQRMILDGRITEMDRDPHDVQTWDEVKAEIWPES